MKTLAIIVPTYNIEDFIGPCLESIVRSKRVRDIQVVVVDDGSTDRSSQVGIEYERRYPCSVEYIRKENGHYGSAVNVGVAAARAQFIRIVDGDDQVDTDGLDSLVAFLDAHPSADAIVSDYMVQNLLTGQRYVQKLADGLPDQVQVGLQDQLPDLVMHSLVYRTDILVQNGIRLSEGLPYTDQEYVLYPLPFVQSIAFHPEVVYVYFLGRDGQTMSRSSFGRSLRAHRSVLDILLLWYSTLRLESVPICICRLIELKLGRMLSMHLAFSAEVLSFHEARVQVAELENETRPYPQLWAQGPTVDIRLLRWMHFRLVGLWILARRMRERLR